MQDHTGDRDRLRARVVEREREMSPRAVGELESQLRRATGLAEYGMPGEQNARDAVRRARERRGFQELRRGRFHGDGGELSGKFHVDLDARAVGFEEDLPAFLRPERARRGARAFDQIRHFRTGGIEQSQVGEGGLRGIEGFCGQRDADEAGRGDLEALAGWPVVQRRGVRLRDSEDSEQRQQTTNGSRRAGGER